MIENEFGHLEGAVAIATRKRDARRVVHSLDHGVGVLTLGAEAATSSHTTSENPACHAGMVVVDGGHE
jgi:hypothetical protein